MVIDPYVGQRIRRRISGSSNIQVGAVYTIKQILSRPGGNSIMVSLKEIPNASFNTYWFDETDEQSVISKKLSSDITSFTKYLKSATNEVAN